MRCGNDFFLYLQPDLKRERELPCQQVIRKSEDVGGLLKDYLITYVPLLGSGDLETDINKGD